MEDRQVPYYVYEGEQARAERHVKRLWILCIIIFLALIGTNAGWIIYESQFEDIVITQDGKTDAGGNITLSGVAEGTINNYGIRETDYPSETEEDGRQDGIPEM